MVDIISAAAVVYGSYYWVPAPAPASILVDLTALLQQPAATTAATNQVTIFLSLVIKLSDSRPALAEILDQWINAVGGGGRIVSLTHHVEDYQVWSNRYV